VEQTVSKFGGVNIVINCAGIINATPIVSSRGVATSAEFLKVFNINVLGTFNVSKYAAQQMMKQPVLNEEKERGVIINVASVAGFEGQRGQVIYAGSKGAIIGMTLPMARDLGKYGIRVVTIAPGVFITPMGKGLNPKIQKSLEDQTTVGRLGVPREFGDAIVSLSRNSYVTGTTLRLDGGIRLSHV
jgi:NAD(P)-dependent dehydrogenase (short-subunit alcohol dehydrogenase family)